MQVAGRVQGTGEEMGGNWTTIIAKSIKYRFFKKKDNSGYLLDGPAPGGDSFNSVCPGTTLSWQSL